MLIFTEEVQKEKTIEEPFIDLGTIYSYVGIFKNDSVEIIQNELGNKITPSVVAFTDEECLVGEGAKNQAALNPKRTIYSVKRLIGRRYNDKEVQMEKNYYMILLIKLVNLIFKLKLNQVKKFILLKKFLLWFLLK